MAKTILEQCLQRVEREKLRLRARLQGVSVEEMLRQEQEAEVQEFRKKLLDALTSVRQQKSGRINVTELATEIAAILREEQFGRTRTRPPKIKIDDIQAIIDLHQELEGASTH